jgi:hypothetical protein
MGLNGLEPGDLNRNQLFPHFVDFCPQTLPGLRTGVTKTSIANHRTTI